MRNPLLIALLLIPCAALADSLNERIDRGFDRIKAGDPETALADFRALQTEQPNSDRVQYGIGYAQYEQGLKQLNGNQSEAGIAAVQQAKSTFDALSESPDIFISKSAQYNAANCAALLAKNIAPNQEYNEALNTYRNSVDAYEQVLENQPNHTLAHKNLDHIRYLLKSMLQNPPPEKENQDKPDGDENQEEQNQDGEQNEDEQDRDEQSESQDGEGQPQENDQQDSSQSQPQPQELDRQNIEAILQSLEDQNREEQKKLRRAKTPSVVKAGKWW